MRRGLRLAIIAALLLTLAATGSLTACGTGPDASSASTASSTHATLGSDVSSTETSASPSSTTALSDVTTTTGVQLPPREVESAVDVVRTYFTSKDPEVLYRLTFQSSEPADQLPDPNWRPQPLDISGLKVAGPLSWVPFSDPLRRDWRERLLFGASFVLNSSSVRLGAPGPKEACVIVARQDSQSAWKILQVNPGPPPQELPAEERKNLDKLSLTEVVRRYLTCFDFDVQVYLSAPRQQEWLVTAVRDPAQPGDITDLVIDRTYSTPPDPLFDWPIQQEVVVTYNLLVARPYANGGGNPGPTGENTRFVIVGRQTPDSPWKVLSVGTGP